MSVLTASKTCVKDDFRLQLLLENFLSTEELAEILEKILFEPGEYELPAEDGTWLKITSASIERWWLDNICFSFQIYLTEKNKRRSKELRSSEESNLLMPLAILTVYEWDGETGEFNFTQGIYSQTPERDRHKDKFQRHQSRRWRKQ